MIKSLNPGGKHVMVSGGSPPSLYMNSYSGQTMVGQMRWNPNSQTIEVYDGNTWMQMPSSYATIGLFPDAEAAIDWAIKKQKEEIELDELCKKHPSVAEAYDHLQILKALTRQHDNDKGQT